MKKGNNKMLYFISKRLLDLLLSILGLFFLSPVLIIISILIRSTSNGPALFFQDRLGKNGKVFKIIKFRTMVVGAEHIGAGIRVAKGNDFRITKVGSFLRKTSLDELPQLFNVLNGTMSLIGPRPPVPYHPYSYNEYPESQKQRFTIRPGITGLAQVKVRNSVPWHERIKWDIKYINSCSLILDMKIMFWTVQKIISRDSIYLD